ncbi:hypothetical protein CARUB_v10027830mg [Capsella rubella]|uniref:Uncharacterized protein n=1 Tax=Capsella rubella TaxID=81985 RepID=R0EV28_9BRAS|nr:hypothetical protein CARUB_v10027830mg [Capsella rubella]
MGSILTTQSGIIVGRKRLPPKATTRRFQRNRGNQENPRNSHKEKTKTSSDDLESQKTKTEISDGDGLVPCVNSNSKPQLDKGEMKRCKLSIDDGCETCNY